MPSLINLLAGTHSLQSDLSFFPSRIKIWHKLRNICYFYLQGLWSQTDRTSFANRFDPKSRKVASTKRWTSSTAARARPSPTSKRLEIFRRPGRRSSRRPNPIPDRKEIYKIFIVFVFEDVQSSNKYNPILLFIFWGHFYRFLNPCRDVTRLIHRK